MHTHPHKKRVENYGTALVISVTVEQALNNCIICFPFQVILTNLSSVNPTRVNGEVLEQSNRLKHGDLITIIDRSFRFVFGVFISISVFLYVVCCTLPQKTYFSQIVWHVEAGEV